MLNNTLNFSVVANNDIAIRIHAKNPDGSLIDITGYAIKWQAFNAAGAAVVTKSTALSGDDQITLSDPANGVFTFMLKAADTKGLTPASYVHEAVTVDAAGHPVTLANDDSKLTVGMMTIRKQFTVQDP